MDINNKDSNFEELKNVFKVLATLLDARNAESAVLKASSMVIVFGYGEDGKKIEQAYDLLFTEGVSHDEEIKENPNGKSSNDDRSNNNEPWLS